MIPFFSVNGLFIGFVAHKLDDADISLFVGLPVAGVLYWVLSRSIDIDAEIRVANAEADELETAAAAHEQP